MRVLVSDTSVLIDLKRGSLLEASFRLPFRFSVPDLLYERELKNWGGEELIRLGLSVEELDGDGVQLALNNLFPPNLASCKDFLQNSLFSHIFNSYSSKQVNCSELRPTLKQAR